MNKNKERDFENATRSLIKQIDSMNLERTERLQVKNFILLFDPLSGAKSETKFLAYPFFGKSFLKKK